MSNGNIVGQSIVMCEVCKTIFKSTELFENHIRQESHLSNLKKGVGLCKYCNICQTDFYYNVITKKMDEHETDHQHLWASAIKLFGNHKVLCTRFNLRPGPVNFLETNPDLLGVNYVVKCVSMEPPYYICYLCGFSPKIEACLKDCPASDDQESVIMGHLMSKEHLRNLIKIHVPRTLQKFDSIYAKEQEREIVSQGHFSKIDHEQILGRVNRKVIHFLPPHLQSAKRIRYLNLPFNKRFDMISHVLSVADNILTEISISNEGEKGEAIKILVASIRESYREARDLKPPDVVGEGNDTCIEPTLALSHSLTTESPTNVVGGKVGGEPDHTTLTIPHDIANRENNAKDLFKEQMLSSIMVSPSFAPPFQDLVILDEVGTSCMEAGNSQNLPDDLTVPDDGPKEVVLPTTTPSEGAPKRFEDDDFTPIEDDDVYDIPVVRNGAECRPDQMPRPGSVAERLPETGGGGHKPNFYVRTKVGRDGRRIITVKKIIKPSKDKYRWRRPGYTVPRGTEGPVGHEVADDDAVATTSNRRSTAEESEGDEEEEEEDTYETRDMHLREIKGANKRHSDRASDLISSALRRSRKYKEMRVGRKGITSANANNLSITITNDFKGKTGHMPTHSSTKFGGHGKDLVNSKNQRLLNEVFSRVRSYVPGMPAVDMVREDFTRESTVWRLLDVVSNIIRTFLTKPPHGNKVLITLFERLQKRYCDTLVVDNSILHNLLAYMNKTLLNGNFIKTDASSHNQVQYATPDIGSPPLIQGSSNLATVPSMNPYPTVVAPNIPPFPIFPDQNMPCMPPSFHGLVNVVGGHAPHVAQSPFSQQHNFVDLPAQNMMPILNNVSMGYRDETGDAIGRNDGSGNGDYGRRRESDHRDFSSHSRHHHGRRRRRQGRPSSRRRSKDRSRSRRSYGRSKRRDERHSSSTEEGRAQLVMVPMGATEQHQHQQQRAFVCDMRNVPPPGFTGMMGMVHGSIAPPSLVGTSRDFRVGDQATNLYPGARDAVGMNYVDAVPDEKMLLKRSLLENRLKQLMELQKQALVYRDDPTQGLAGGSEDSMSVTVHLQTRLNDLVSDPDNSAALLGPGGSAIKNLLQEALRAQVMLLEKNNDRMRIMESSHLAAHNKNSMAKNPSLALNKTYPPRDNDKKIGMAPLQTSTSTVVNNVGSKPGAFKRYFGDNSTPQSVSKTNASESAPSSTAPRYDRFRVIRNDQGSKKYEGSRHQNQLVANNYTGADATSQTQGLSHGLLHLQQGVQSFSTPNSSIFFDNQDPSNFLNDTSRGQKFEPLSQSFTYQAGIPNYYTGGAGGGNSSSNNETQPFTYDYGKVIPQYFTDGQPSKPTAFGQNIGNFSHYYK